MARERVTVVDIASAAGVSKSTVSLVLRGSPLVNEKTRAKVNAVMRDLGYVYNRGAANLRQSSSKSKIVGIVVNDLTNSFFAELAVGVDDVVQSAGYVQFLANTGESIDRQREVIASMREHGISGLVISPARGTEAGDFKPLTASGLPVVLAVRNVPGAKVSTVMSDNRAGAYAATAHLVGLGHRRVAFLGGFADTAVFEDRLAGYRHALRDGGIDADDRAGRQRRPLAGRRRRGDRPRHAGGRAAHRGALPQRRRRFRRLRRAARPPPGAGRRLRGGRLRRRDRGQDRRSGADYGFRRSARHGTGGPPSCSSSRSTPAPPSPRRSSAPSGSWCATAAAPAGRASGKGKRHDRSLGTRSAPAPSPRNG